MGIRLLVCGGRDYDDKPKIYEVLKQINDSHGVDLLVTGGARGADHDADAVGEYMGLTRVIYPANWGGEGRAAGPLRNQRMLDEGKPDWVLAFPGGKGTADMVKRATKAGVYVIRGDHYD